MTRVLVTGCYGYIGSHLCKHLAELGGYEILGLDKKESINDVKPYCSKIIRHNIRNSHSFPDRIDTVVHLAALVRVQESIEFPSLYYSTNYDGTLNIANGINYDNFIFASSGTVVRPSNPYSDSKHLAEVWIKRILPIKTIFRFYNVVGCNGFGQIGQSTHLIKTAVECLLHNKPFTVYGTDYNTIDGTAVRDYIHVNDVCNSLVEAIKTPSSRFIDNLGTSRGYSVLEVLNVLQRVTGKKLEIITSDRREGDLEKTVVDGNKISDYFTQTHTLEDMCYSTYDYERGLL